MSRWRLAAIVLTFHSILLSKSEKLKLDQSPFNQAPWQLQTSPNTQYNPGPSYLQHEGNTKYDESFNVVPDKIADKNFDAPEVATATTGGLPFISYALRGIAWLFVVGTLFLMFVGTVSAAFYRWTKAYASGRELGQIEVTQFVMKAVEEWMTENNNQ